MEVTQGMHMPNKELLATECGTFDSTCLVFCLASEFQTTIGCEVEKFK